MVKQSQGNNTSRDQTMNVGTFNEQAGLAAEIGYSGQCFEGLLYPPGTVATGVGLWGQDFVV